MIGSGVVVGTDFYDNSYKLLTNGNSRSTKCCVKYVDNSTITHWKKVYIIQQRDLLELLIFFGLMKGQIMWRKPMDISLKHLIQAEGY